MSPSRPQLAFASRGSLAALLRVTALLHLLLWTGGASVGFLAPQVLAQTQADGSYVVVVSGTCPDGRAVKRVLSTLLPRTAASAPDASAPPTVADRGDSYVVAVGDRVKTYMDAPRDCAERARVAAAFIALAAAPGAEASVDAGAVTPDASATALPTPVPAPIPTPSTAPRGWLRVNGLGVLVVSSPGTLVAAGASIGIAAGRGVFGAEAACGWLSGATLHVAGQSDGVLLERIPCAVGPIFRLIAPSGRLETDLEAGLALGAVRASGRGFANTYASSRFEVGARAAVLALVHLGRGRETFVPMFGFEATYYPMVYDLDVTARGVVAQTPSVWAGVTAGAGWTLE